MSAQSQQNDKKLQHMAAHVKRCWDNWACLAWRKLWVGLNGNFLMPVRRTSIRWSQFLHRWAGVWWEDEIQDESGEVLTQVGFFSARTVKRWKQLFKELLQSPSSVFFFRPVGRNDWINNLIWSHSFPHKDGDCVLSRSNFSFKNQQLHGLAMLICKLRDQCTSVSNEITFHKFFK